MSVQSLYNKLELLNLNNFAKALDNNYSAYEKQDLSFHEILELLADIEINHRHNKKIQNLIKGAKFRYSNARIEDIDYTNDRKLKKALITPLLDFQWLYKNRGIIITGATGTGKTWLANALGNQACRFEIKTTFIQANQLYEELNMALFDKTIARIKQKYMKSHLLIIDDFGLGGVDSNITPILLEIIDKQERNGGLIITSQFPTELWFDFFEDKSLADAILDRIVHRSHLIELQGESMRKLKSVS